MDLTLPIIPKPIDLEAARQLENSIRNEELQEKENLEIQRT